MTFRSPFPRARRGGTVPNAGNERQRGQATVEFAFVLPLLLLAAMAIIQVGLVVRDQMGVVHAAREAAREASVDPDPDEAVRAAHRTLPGPKWKSARGPASAARSRSPCVTRRSPIFRWWARCFPTPSCTPRR